MLRSVLLVLLSFSTPVAALAAGCEGFDVKTFVGDVPYFSTRMDQVPTGDGSIRLSHVDDSRIVVSIGLDALPVSALTSRSKYIESVTERLDSQISGLQGDGVSATRAVFPYDPVTWAVLVEDAGQRAIGGDMGIRLSSECEIGVEWSAPDTSALAGRVSEVRLSLDALRALAAGHVEPASFLEENTTPSGPISLLSGVLAPLLAACVLTYLLGGMRMLARPGVPPRAIAAAAAVTALGSFVLQYPAFSAGLTAMVYVDAALLLAATFVSVAIAVTGRQDAMLWGLSLSVICGLTMAVAAYLEWSTDPAIGFGTAAFLFGLGAAGLLLWNHQETADIRRRRVRAS